MLSKSTFMYGCQCPKRLYLHKFHKEFANPEDEETQVIFQRGTDVGVLAQELFPGGANAQGSEQWHSYKTVAATKALMKTHSVIYEAAFIYDNVLCAVDILVKRGSTYYAYEVKSTTSVKDQHIPDAALQYHVLTQAGINLADFSIVHLNTAYTRNGALDVQQLFTAESVLEQVLEQQESITPKIAELKDVLAKGEIPAIAMGEHCNKPYPCDFSIYCGGGIEEEEAPEVEVNSDISYNPEALAPFIKSVHYPIFYFDFETVMYAIPEFNQSHAYQQIPFQYSLHVQAAPGAAPTHVAFLGDGQADPREALIKQMLTDMGTTGSVMVWNKTFEKGCIEKMAKQFPAYEKPLLALVNRMVDLMAPFRSKHVNSAAFYGSYSIKYVLPVMVPELSYENLEIGNGGVASFTYGQLAQMDPKQKETVRSQLLEYCHLDTLAMVRIWERVEKFQ